MDSDAIRDRRQRGGKPAEYFRRKPERNSYRVRKP